MCTVSLICLPDGVFRVACNRDEQRSRPTSLPLEIRRFGHRTAILPIDPVSDGTWIAVNDAGVVLAMLNRTPTPPNPFIGLRSRGEIIPLLLHAKSAEQCIQAARALPMQSYSCFRLIAIDAAGMGQIIGSPGGMTPDYHAGLPHAVVFSSSGLGDDMVAEPRRTLFEEMVVRQPELTASSQDRFHRHAWPDASHLSVCMSRPDARTVSYTVIEIGTGTAVCHHFDGPPDAPSQHTSRHLTLRAADV